MYCQLFILLVVVEVQNMQMLIFYYLCVIVLLLYYCTPMFRNTIIQYITDFVFCQPPLSVRLSSLTSYYIPRDGPQTSYKEYISMLPSTEHPEVFGQHPNADIASQIAETRTLFDTLLSLQPQVSSPTAAGAGPSREDKVRGKLY